jgi:hypothetical protein
LFIAFIISHPSLVLLIGGVIFILIDKLIETGVRGSWRREDWYLGIPLMLLVTGSAHGSVIGLAIQLSRSLQGGQPCSDCLDVANELTATEVFAIFSLLVLVLFITINHISMRNPGNETAPGSGKVTIIASIESCVSLGFVVIFSTIKIT